MLSTAMKEESLISRILMDAKSKRHSILTQVNSTPLPDTFISFMDQYETHFEPRDRFLWKWLWILLKNGDDGFMLSSVPANRRILSAEIKLLLTMAVTIVDDAGDQGKDRLFLDALLSVPFNNGQTNLSISSEDIKKVELLISIFDYSYRIFESMPFWKNYSGIFEFDIKQVWNACLYSFLLNQRPSILNYSESMRFTSFNMMVFLYLDTDLIFSEGIDENDIGGIREVVMKTQEMARIGNWVSTWEREVNESDLSSGIFAKIVTDGHITAEKLEKQLKNPDSSTLLMLIKESLIENKLLVEWEELREAALELAASVKSVDMVKYVLGFDNVLIYHLTSTGHK
jgi:hypothetical protein